MPIRDENKARYPKDWPQISKAIRERAGQRCEKCAAPNGALILREFNEYGHVYITQEDRMFAADNGSLLGRAYFAARDYTKAVKVILTVAHLDHQPENCDPENLRAWCQRCHLAYDAPMRRAGIKSRAKANRAIGDLFT